MPLLDHFRPPLFPHRHWESFHVNWAGALADVLNNTLLPEGYFAEEHALLGPRVEIDVATFANGESATSSTGNGSRRTALVATWKPPAPAVSVPAAFPDTFEVLVFDSGAGATLVAAIEIISPGNKDREAHRQAFVVKCASYLARGISLIIIDIVTTRQANLHNELMTLLGHTQGLLPESTFLYAVAYRPIVRAQQELIDLWPVSLSVGATLPTLPLALNAELCLPLNLETTYTIACERRRLRG